MGTPLTSHPPNTPRTWRPAGGTLHKTGDSQGLAYKMADNNAEDGGAAMSPGP
jgi:hypothetical protein